MNTKQALQAIAKIDRAHLIQFPTGKFGFVGKVPTVLLYAASEEEIVRLLGAGCAQFLPRRVWTTAEEAMAAAETVTL